MPQDESNTPLVAKSREGQAAFVKGVFGTKKPDTKGETPVKGEAPSTQLDTVKIEAKRPKGEDDKSKDLAAAREAAIKKALGQGNTTPRPPGS